MLLIFNHIFRRINCKVQPSFIVLTRHSICSGMELIIRSLIKTHAYDHTLSCRYGRMSPCSLVNARKIILGIFQIGQYLLHDLKTCGPVLCDCRILCRQCRSQKQRNATIFFHQGEVVGCSVEFCFSNIFLQILLAQGLAFRCLVEYCIAVIDAFIWS